MLSLLAAAVLAPKPLAERVREDLEAAVQGMPIHGHRFRSTVERIGVEWPDETGLPTRECSFSHPLGRTDSTLVRIGGGPFDILSFIVFKQEWRTRVEALNVATDFDDGSIDAVAGLTAWSGRRICTFVHYPGGTGNSDGVRLFQVSGHGLRLVKHLEGYGENAWDGGLTHDSIVSVEPVDICESLTVRYPAPGLEDIGGHSDIWLDYHQVWRFSGGRLRQIEFRLLNTPAAAFYHLCHLFDHGRRREFNRLVPKRFQQRLWKELAVVDHDAHMSFDGDDYRDECPNLLIGRVLPVTFGKLHGKWVVTKVEKRLPKPDYG